MVRDSAMVTMGSAYRIGNHHRSFERYLRSFTLYCDYCAIYDHAANVCEARINRGAGHYFGSKFWCVSFGLLEIRAVEVCSLQNYFR